MMFLFRSTFITAISALVITLCAFSISASAAPQFGRPMLHVLDAVTASESVSYLAPVPSPTGGVVDLAPIEAVPTSGGGDPDPDPQAVEVASTSSTPSTSTAAATQAVVSSSTSTSGASRSLCGGVSVFLGVAVSAVWLVL
ncbi:hypothetical protein M405DRAFT_378496 [Rhizopogon salebrosus TDB-379]|nr:hypothetical protein M405DRAFT_378496 [Rhizopogon salebrosus TDB-379]